MGTGTATRKPCQLLWTQFFWCLCVLPKEAICSALLKQSSLAVATSLLGHEHMHALSWVQAATLLVMGTKTCILTPGQCDPAVHASILGCHEISGTQLLFTRGIKVSVLKQQPTSMACR